MWLGFSWLLPVKCKRKDVRIREELNKKKKAGLDEVEESWLSRSPKTLKSGASHSRKSVLDTKPRVWLEAFV